MKCRCLAVVLVTLVPAFARAQNPQFTNCRSLESTGNFVAADEVLVNGQVCKVATAKNANSTATPDKAADKNKALLGIIEPETLRAKDKPAPSLGAATANAAVLQGEPNQAPTANSAATASAGQSESFGMVQQGSLGAIARAYRKETPQRANPEQAGLVEKKRNGLTESKAANVETAVMPATDVEAAPAATVVSSTKPATPKIPEKPDVMVAATAPHLTTAVSEPQTPNSEIPVAAPTPPLVTKPDTVPIMAPPATAPVAPPAKTEDHVPVVTVAPALEPKLETKQAAAEAPEVLPVQPETKPADNPPASAPQTQETVQTNTVAPAPSPTLAPQSEANTVSTIREEPPATEANPVLEKAAHTGASATPAEAEPDRQPMVDSEAEIGAFREGQMPNCRKNISLGSMTKDNLFLSIPDWAMAWYGKNQKRFPGICFSNAIMPGAKNFLVVFYTTPTAADGDPKTQEQKAPAAELSTAKAQGSFTTSIGSMWHYSVEKEVTTTITSVSADKAPHNQQPAVIFATAYSEQGIPVAQHRPSHPVTIEKDKGKSKATSKKTKKQEPVDPTSAVMANLLSEMVQDIAKH